MTSKNNNHHATRNFRRILDKAQKQSRWEEIARNTSGHLAKGILTTNKAAYPADLAYNCDLRLLSLSVRINAQRIRTTNQLISLLRLQNGLSQLGFVTLDLEMNILHVHTRTLVDSLCSGHTIKAFFQNAVNTLENRDLHNLLN